MVLVAVACAKCGGTKEVPHSELKRHKYFFCDDNCYNEWRGKRIKINCIYCGKERLIKQSDNKRVKNHFCDQGCYGKWRSDYQKGKNNPFFSGGKIKRFCELCGIKFEISPSNLKYRSARFHSPECYYAWKKQKLLEQANVEITCEFCGKKKFIRKSKFIRDKHHTCGKACDAKLKSKLRILGGNPNWHNGASFEPYPLLFNRAFKERIRERDCRVCQLCGIQEEDNNKLLSVHHIDYNKKNLDPFNHISLCEKDHIRTNANRKFWALYLKGLVLERIDIARSFSE